MVSGFAHLAGGSALGHSTLSGRRLHQPVVHQARPQRRLVTLAAGGNEQPPTPQPDSRKSYDNLEQVGGGDWLPLMLKKRPLCKR